MRAELCCLLVNQEVTYKSLLHFPQDAVTSVKSSTFILSQFYVNKLLFPNHAYKHAGPGHFVKLAVEGSTVF
jgi:hypothetical protein